MQAQRAIVNYRLSRTIFTRVLRGTSTSFSIILPRCLTPFNVFHVEHQATTTHSYLRIAYLAEPASVLQVQVTRRRALAPDSTCSGDSGIAKALHSRCCAIQSCRVSRISCRCSCTAAA